MDLKQIEYIVKIDDEHSITRAAEKLFVTQSALNQQLLRLEKELGAPLFHRSKVDMRPTEIGQVYLDNAREILRIKQRTYNLINDMTDAKKVASGESNFLNSSLSNTSLSPTIKGVSFGTSIPIALLPGIGASILILLAAKLNAISSVKFTILLTFTPGLGCISYLVIVGPTVT